jgi:capsid portal protein
MNKHALFRNIVEDYIFTPMRSQFTKKTNVSFVTVANMQKSTAHFSLDPFPEDILDMIPWFESASLSAQEFKIKAKTPQGVEQIMSLFSVFTIG